MTRTSQTGFSSSSSFPASSFRSKQPNTPILPLSEVHAACCVLGGEGELPRRDSHPEPRNCSVAQACTVPGPTYRLAPRYAEKIVRSSSTSSPRSNRARELSFAAVLLCSHKYSQISAQIHMHLNKKWFAWRSNNAREIKFAAALSPPVGTIQNQLLK